MPNVTETPILNSSLETEEVPFPADSTLEADDGLGTIFQGDDGQVLTNRWVVSDKVEDLVEILNENDNLRQENYEVKKQLQKQSMELDILLERNAQLEEDSKMVPNLETLQSTLKRLEHVFRKVVKKMGQDMGTCTQSQVEHSEKWTKETWGTYKVEVDALLVKIGENLSSWEQAKENLEGNLEDAEEELKQWNITGVIPSPSLQHAKKLTVENKLSQSIIATGQAFQKMRAIPSPPVSYLEGKLVSRPASPVSIPTSVITHSSLKPHNSCIAPETPEEAAKQRNFQQIPTKLTKRSVAKQGSFSLNRYSTWPLTNKTGNRKKMTEKPWSTSKAASLAEDVPVGKQNICGLCGGSFNSLNQLKHHHTVIHSKITVERALTSSSNH